MYLLNPGMYIPSLKLIKFTFHYVSIKSIKLLICICPVRNLHSTMYLLNLMGVMGTVLTSIFTFHYVSIKSYTV